MHTRSRSASGESANLAPDCPSSVRHMSVDRAIAAPSVHNGFTGCRATAFGREEAVAPGPELLLIAVTLIVEVAHGPAAHRDRVRAAWQRQPAGAAARHRPPLAGVVPGAGRAGRVA